MDTTSTTTPAKLKALNACMTDPSNGGNNKKFKLRDAYKKESFLNEGFPKTLFLMLLVTEIYYYRLYWYL